MDEKQPDPVVCDAAITLAFSILGKRWNGMILRMIGSDVSQFVELRRSVPGISDTVLSDRLSELTAAGLVSREVAAGPPVAVSYRLTAQGEPLVPLLDQIGEWASANLVPNHAS